MVSPTTSSYRNRTTLSARKRECARVHARRPTHTPVVVEPPLAGDTKEKFLVPHGLTAGQFAYVLRKRLRLRSSDALFLLCGGCAAPATALMQDLHRRHRDEDGFLYVSHTLENAFGGW